MSRLAIVVIGRNEGDRLARCFTSVAPAGVPLVYVDSGSTDGSPEFARKRGVVVVELDSSAPFTAARARNEGLARLLLLQPDLDLVQFLDGDCELDPDWLAQGQRELCADDRIAATCGRVSELNRDLSVYNRLCDLEWSAPTGEARSCGGNVLMRVQALQEVGGFNPKLIGGEEPELCLRLRDRGWRIWRSTHPMVRHDAEMTRFVQWWRRALRSGWAYAEGAAVHRGGPDRPWQRENRSIIWWGALLPMMIAILAWASHGFSLLLLAGYPALAARTYFKERRSGLSNGDASLRAVFLTLAKFPQAIGQIQFLYRRTRPVVDWRTG